jgi:hypothetical protein
MRVLCDLRMDLRTGCLMYTHLSILNRAYVNDCSSIFEKLAVVRLLINRVVTYIGSFVLSAA